MKKHLLILLFVLVAFLSACAPERDPRNQADAYATRSQADEAAADSQQKRDIKAADQAVKMATAAYWADVRSVAAPVLKYSVMSLVIAGTLVVAGMFASTGMTYHYTARQVGAAFAVRTMLKANLIPLDAETRQYPLLRHVHKDRYALVNPNDGSVRMLDAAQQSDRQLITAMGAVQLAGVMAMEARKGKTSDHAYAISGIQPALTVPQKNAIEYENSRRLTVREIWEMSE